MAHALGSTVKQVVPIIQGLVKDVKYDAATQKFSYHVVFELDGETRDRWFEEHQVELVAGPVVADAPPAEVATV